MRKHGRKEWAQFCPDLPGPTSAVRHDPDDVWHRLPGPVEIGVYAFNHFRCSLLAWRSGDGQFRSLDNAHPGKFPPRTPGSRNRDACQRSQHGLGRVDGDDSMQWPGLKAVALELRGSSRCDWGSGARRCVAAQVCAACGGTDKPLTATGQAALSGQSIRQAHRVKRRSPPCPECPPQF